MTLTTEQLRAVETTKEFRALLKYMRAIAKAEPESVKEKFELEEGLWRYASQKTIKAIVGHIDALEFALAANREAQPVEGELGEIRVGRLPTMNQENYPGLGDWWVQLRIGENHDEILARVYGATPEEAVARAHLLTAPPAPAVPEEMKRDPDADVFDPGFMNGWNACRAAMLAQPVSSGYKLVPAEPTEDMIAAAMNCDDVTFNADETFCVNFGNIYAAMLAAAPEGGNDHDTRR